MGDLAEVVMEATSEEDFREGFAPCGGPAGGDVGAEDGGVAEGGEPGKSYRFDSRFHNTNYMRLTPNLAFLLLGEYTNLGSISPWPSIHIQDGSSHLSCSQAKWQLELD